MTKQEILKNAKPILFNGEMVRAILDGRKTVTRRVLGEKQWLDKKWGLDREPYAKGNKWFYDEQTKVDESQTHELKSRHQSGDFLYVRETFNSDWCDHTIYKADGGSAKEAGYSAEPKWHPSIHMPKEAARIFLRVTGVKVERLQDITEEQAKAEGAKAYGRNNCSGTSARIAFAEIWDKTVSEKQYEFFSNPWVWAYEFERLEGAK